MPLRQPLPTDAPGIAMVHIQAWRETYTGIMPQSYLDGLTVERSAAIWRERLHTTPTRQATMLATTEEGEIVGFASSGPVRNADLPADGEIFAVNILQKAKRKKLGTQLMLAMSESLLTFGFSKVGLWVLNQNAPARTFYDRLGGQPIATALRDFGGEHLLEQGYVWPTVHDLKKSAENLLLVRSSS